MLGSVQTLIETPTGDRISYSGDFGWPLSQIPKSDTLVIDATYGSSRSPKRHPKKEVDQSLLDLVHDSLSKGAVHIKAHRGTLSRCLAIINQITNCPIVASDSTIKELKVYQQFGYPISQLTSLEDIDSESFKGLTSFIRVYSKGDGDPTGFEKGTSIYLSAYQSNDDSPLLKLSSNAYRIAMSDHADFENTLDYISESGAKKVITDNYRNRNHAHSLAEEIKTRLSIEAYPSIPQDPLSEY